MLGLGIRHQLTFSVLEGWIQEVLGWMENLSQIAMLIQFMYSMVVLVFWVEVEIVKARKGLSASLQVLR